jgi:beta-N-acetylhexosaminidase
MFSKGGPVKQARLTNKFQSLSKTPLVISLDAEWGPAMRLDSVPSFPRQMMMGAIQNDKVLFDFGQEVGRQCTV